ncbi:CDC16 protein [Marasmius sp. AFHP31]|nr:CDC16 protein [Marasmius sp. AFHP31]KAK1229209.1 CDC16 protein [Marasmius sp. AFHP31]
MSTDAGAATAHSFNKILSKPKYPSKSRGSGGETDEDSNIKKLRRLILVEGIPANVIDKKRKSLDSPMFKG